MNNWYLAMIIGAFLISLAIALVAVIKIIGTKKTIDGIEDMLDSAIKGDFEESRFSEEKISKLESKFADYLQSSSLSAMNVKNDRDKIKTLISDISHQTKTPIANLLLHSELLRESDLNKDQMESLDAISGEAEKLRFLVDALVKLSRLENGILALEPKQDDLQRVLKDVSTAMRKKAEAKGLYLNVTGESEIASFDYKWTLEAVSNIVDNAIKYTENGGIEIAFKSTEMFACISIKDTGIGILEEDIPKIFARFERLQSSRDKEGVGIGLYLAREIIQKEGGYIKVKSRKGEGSEFLINLKK
ncbi:MAG: HAMP domain-containing histidine kinase [Lachnospiraceae bacterium]|nr:HAMP domain-containing histidine kinase [Lachnospiraceae bacterium]